MRLLRGPHVAESGKAVLLGLRVFSERKKPSEAYCILKLKKTKGQV